MSPPISQSRYLVFAKPVEKNNNYEEYDKENEKWKF